MPLDAQILTRRGWLSYDEVRVGDETPGFNFATGRTEWTRVVAVSGYDDLEVFESTSRAWSVRSTSGHRWIARNSESGEHFWTTTGDNGRWPWRVAAPMSDGPGLDITEDEAELLGWLITDGSQWESSEICRFDGCDNPARAKGLCGSHRRQQRAGKPLTALRRAAAGRAVPCFSMFVWQTKQEGVRRLTDILGERAGRNRNGFRLHDAYARDALVRFGIDHIKNTDQLLVIVAKMTQVQREAMLRGVLGGDGLPGTVGARGAVTGQRIYQDDGPMIAVLSTLAYYCGYRVRATERHTGHAGYGGIGIHMTISLSQPFVSTRRQGARPVGRTAVWCPRTELGSWTALFNGNPILTGNCRSTTESEGMLSGAPGNNSGDGDGPAVRTDHPGSGRRPRSPWTRSRSPSRVPSAEPRPTHYEKVAHR